MAALFGDQQVPCAIKDQVRRDRKRAAGGVRTIGAVARQTSARDRLQAAVRIHAGDPVGVQFGEVDPAFTIGCDGTRPVQRRKRGGYRRGKKRMQIAANDRSDRAVWRHLPDAIILLVANQKRPIRKHNGMRRAVQFRRGGRPAIARFGAATERGTTAGIDRRPLPAARHRGDDSVRGDAPNAIGVRIGDVDVPSPVNREMIHLLETRRVTFVLDSGQRQRGQSRLPSVAAETAGGSRDRRNDSGLRKNRREEKRESYWKTHGKHVGR